MCYATNRLGSAQEFLEVGLEDIHGEGEDEGEDQIESSKRAKDDADAELRTELDDFRQEVERELGALRNSSIRMRAAAVADKDGDRFCF